MILELTASVALSGAISTRASSETASYAVTQLDAGRRHLQNSYSVGLGSVFHELIAVAEECSEPDWDGYGAEPVSDESYRTAYRLLEALPLGTSAPTVGADPDGQLTLEWHRSPRRTLSISSSSQNELHYAALIGPNRAFGMEAFFGEVPARVVELIRRVGAA